VEEGARVHKASRLVAPVFVGCGATVARSAVVTRFSNLERNCRIGEGTVVDGATVLPYTALGNWLDVSHAVVDGNQFADLAANVSFEISDPRMFCDLAPRNLRIPPHRKLGSPVEPGKDELSYGSFQGWSRAAGRLAEVFFKG
jgi:NDP-sugar pyrophosphorylase family protein